MIKGSACLAFMAAYRFLKLNAFLRINQSLAGFIFQELSLLKQVYPIGAMYKYKIQGRLRISLKSSGTQSWCQICTIGLAMHMIIP
jgi:hypothetical protein